MSGPSGPDRCEPNLTPLLDMVLQLIMFFMLCANFDKFQKNQAVTLPKAAQAQAPDKTIDVQLLVELGAPPKAGEMGKLSLSTGDGPKPLQGPTQLTERLGLEAQKHQIGKFAEPDAPKKKKTRVAVILRADQNSTFRQIFEIMTAIQKAGFEDIQLRALKG